MATIKAYTDIEQSKKLAEILPLENADMYYILISIDDYGTGTYKPALLEESFKGNLTSIPCWSLAALLGVLPKNLNIGRPLLGTNYMEYYWIQYYDEFMKPNNYKTECLNNPVDACVDMIERLHELNLL